MVRISTSLILAILLVGAVIVVAYQASDLFSPPVLRSSERDVMDKISPYLLEKFDEEKIVRVDVFMKGAFSGEPISEKAFNRIIKKVGAEKVSKSLYPTGFVAELTQDEVFELAQNKRVLSIEFSYTYRTFLQDAVNIIGATDVWQVEVEGVFLTGQGQSICIIDTGIDFSHPDLANKNIVGDNLNCLEGFCFPDPDTTDLNGHGTHIAGIAAAAPAQGGEIPGGIAKGSDLIGLKVFPGDQGDGNIGIELVNAIFWCIENREQYSISAISLSLGTDILFEDYCDDDVGALASIVDLAVGNNIAVVAATGNDGSNTRIGAPACIQNSIPVGATKKDDTVASYSNYNGIVKIFAPGGDVDGGGWITTTEMGGGYGLSGGTSASTPMVSASIAIINQYLELSGQGARTMHPIDEIEPLLFNIAEEIFDLSFESWRRINIFNAIMALIPEDLCPADFDDSGDVGVKDLLMLLGSWGPCEGCLADLDGSGDVGVKDLLMLLGSWGPCPEGLNGGGYGSEEAQQITPEAENILKDFFGEKEYNKIISEYNQGKLVS